MQFMKQARIEYLQEGARQVLAGLEHLPAVQTALRQIENGVVLEVVAHGLGTSLQRWLDEQQEQTRRLERELSHERFQRSSYETWFQEQKATPLQKELDQTRSELVEAETRRKAAEEAKARYLEALDHRRREIQQMQSQILELNRVIARQHEKLQDLLGPEQPK